MNIPSAADKGGPGKVTSKHIGVTNSKMRWPDRFDDDAEHEVTTRKVAPTAKLDLAEVRRRAMFGGF